MPGDDLLAKMDVSRFQVKGAWSRATRRSDRPESRKFRNTNRIAVKGPNTMGGRSQ
jgi:hypothetical protein